MNFVANLPHIKCYVRKEYLRDLEDGHGEFVDATIIAVTSEIKRVTEQPNINMANPS